MTDTTPERLVCDFIECTSCEYGARLCDDVAAAVIAHVTPGIEAKARAAAIEDAVKALCSHPGIDYIGTPTIDAIRSIATAPQGHVCVPIKALAIKRDPAPQPTNEQHGDSGLTGSVPAAVSGTDFQITRPAQPGQNLLTASSNEDHAAGAARGKGDTPETNALMWRVVQGEKIDGEILEAFRTIERQRDSALAKLKEK